MTLGVISSMTFCAAMYFYKTTSFKQVGWAKWEVTNLELLSNLYEVGCKLDESQMPSLINSCTIKKKKIMNTYALVG